MNEYILLFRGGEHKELQQSPENWQKHMERWMGWMDSLAKQEVFVGAQPLTADGRVVTGPNKVISDGPFIEGKEMVGGYLICKAESYADAVELSKGCPILEFDGGTVEVRQIAELKM